MLPRTAWHNPPLRKPISDLGAPLLFVSQASATCAQEISQSQFHRMIPSGQFLVNANGIICGWNWMQTAPTVDNTDLSLIKCSESGSAEEPAMFRCRPISRPIRPSTPAMPPATDGRQCLAGFPDHHQLPMTAKAAFAHHVVVCPDRHQSMGLLHSQFTPATHQPLHAQSVGEGTLNFNSDGSRRMSRRSPATGDIAITMPWSATSGLSFPNHQLNMGRGQHQGVTNFRQLGVNGQTVNGSPFGA